MTQHACRRLSAPGLNNTPTTCHRITVPISPECRSGRWNRPGTWGLGSPLVVTHESAAALTHQSDGELGERGSNGQGDRKRGVDFKQIPHPLSDWGVWPCTVKNYAWVLVIQLAKLRPSMWEKVRPLTGALNLNSFWWNKMFINGQRVKLVKRVS